MTNKRTRRNEKVLTLSYRTRSRVTRIRYNERVWLEINEDTNDPLYVDVTITRWNNVFPCQRIYACVSYARQKSHVFPCGLALLRRQLPTLNGDGCETINAKFNRLLSRFTAYGIFQSSIVSSISGRSSCKCERACLSQG